MSFNPHNWYLLGLHTVKYNLFIGNVANEIPDRTTLANKLDYYVGLGTPNTTPYSINDIKNFTIVGNDIKCTMLKDYEIRASTSFQDSGLTYFRDYEKCKGFFPFRGNANLVDIYLPECLIIYGLNGGYSQWVNSPKLDILYMPKCVNFGQTVGLDYVFRSGYGAPKFIYVDPIIQTCNGGNPDSDVAVGISNGATFRYVDNFIIPDSIIDLAANIVYDTSIILSWSAPNSTNTIDYYEVYIDDIFYRKVNSTTELISNLTNMQIYKFEVIAVDIYYNKSKFNNAIAQQINGNPMPYMEYLWKAENNILEESGLVNGISSLNVSYVDGRNGKAFSFNGIDSYINLGQSSYVNIQGDLTLMAWVKLNDYTNDSGSCIITTINGTGTVYNYHFVVINTGILRFNNQVTAVDSVSIIPLDTWVHLCAVREGQMGRIYINGILDSEVPITAPVNPSNYSFFSISRDDVQHFDGLMDDIRVINKALTQPEIVNKMNELN